VSGRQHEDVEESDQSGRNRPLHDGDPSPATVRRAAGATGHGSGPSLSRDSITELQGLIGNRSTTRYLQRSVAPVVIQRWPGPEVDDQPPKSTFKIYKCHDAVVYWVLRSLKISREEAIAGIKLAQQKRGPSSDWIVDALGYGEGTRINAPGDVKVGDLLFTGDLSFVAHTMVVLDKDHIVGFNNYGTFGTDGGGDLYSVENFSADHFWHDKDGKQQIGTRSDASFPIFRLPIATAQKSLETFIDQVRTEKDRELPTVALTDEELMAFQGTPKTKKKGCYISTAVTMTRGLPDDCEELEVLRAFRDNFILTRPGGSQLVGLYYRYAPAILDEIAKQENAGDVYRELYAVIQSCVESIKRNDNDFAYRTYCDMVVRLKDQYIPRVELPPYQP
jgi:hypothetical protein